MAYTVYRVHANKKKNSPVIAEGVRKDICNKLNLDEYYFGVMSRDKSNVLADTYYVDKYTSKEKPQYIGVNSKKREAEKKVKKKSKFDTKIETIEKMLDIHGNTGIFDDSKRILKRLEKDGYRVEVEYRPKRVIKSIDNSTAPEIWDEIWVLTLVKKENKGNV